MKRLIRVFRLEAVFITIVVYNPRQNARIWSFNPLISYSVPQAYNFRNFQELMTIKSWRVLPRRIQFFSEFARHLTVGAMETFRQM